MSKVKKSTQKAINNRNRVNFHRRWKSIVNQGNLVTNNNNDFNQDNNSNVVQNNSSSQRLRRWALNYNISKRAVSDLLNILISLGMTWLPKDSRTLLSTPRYVEMKNLTNGKLWYVVI